MDGNREFFAAMKPGDWFDILGNYETPRGPYRLIRIHSGMIAGGYGQISAEIVDAITGRITTAYLNQWDVGPPTGRPTIRCAHCGSDNSGGWNGWSGRSEGSTCRCWDGHPDYAYLGLNPITPSAAAMN